MFEIDLATIALLAIAAFTAGWLDAIGGGGGLIQLPALLLALPVDSTAVAIGTNKISSLIGTSASAISYSKKVKPPLVTVAPMMAAAFIGSVFGSILAVNIEPEVFRPVILVLLIVVWVVTWRNPVNALKTIEDHEPPVHSKMTPILWGLGIGFYDGAIGPGTGIFLLALLVNVIGLSFLRSSATAKFVNLATNFASLLVFMSFGNIYWALGLSMGLANLTGSLIGTKLAIKHGSPFVRKILLIAVAALIVRLAISLF
jgi:hypothetical protein